MVSQVFKLFQFTASEFFLYFRHFVELQFLNFEKGGKCHLKKEGREGGGKCRNFYT